MHRYSTHNDVLRYSTHNDVLRYSTHNDILRYSTHNDVYRYNTPNDSTQNAPSSSISSYAVCIIHFTKCFSEGSPELTVADEVKNRIDSRVDVHNQCCPPVKRAVYAAPA